MKKEKEDRRVKYTRMVLKESFIRLLEEKDISQITIKEICDRADINRTTFYAHYSDPYDLMRKIENELLDNVTSYLSDHLRKSFDVNIVTAVERIFEYIRENASICKLLLSERGDINFQKRIMTLVYDTSMDNLLSRGMITREQAEYIHAFIITGCVGVVQKWLDEDMAQSSRQMAEMLVTLSLGLPGFLSEAAKPI